VGSANWAQSRCAETGTAEQVGRNGIVGRIVISRFAVLKGRGMSCG
jgi:hypothetical protein